MCQLPPDSQRARRSHVAVVAAPAGLAVSGIMATSGAAAIPRLRAWWVGLRCRPRARIDMMSPLAACEVSCRVLPRGVWSYAATIVLSRSNDLTPRLPAKAPDVVPPLLPVRIEKWA